MMSKKSFSAVLICLALSGASAMAVDAPQPVAPKRGAAKTRPQYFNPFDVKRARLKLNRFGFFTTLPSSPVSESSAAAAIAGSLTTPAEVSIPSFQAPNITSGVDTAIASSLVAAAPSELAAVAGLSSMSGGLTFTGITGSVVTASFAAAQETTAPASSMSTRPPFRPPVRSPFRPPPRPPF